MTFREAAQLVRDFENCSLPKHCWTHEAHFIMAFWYCYHLPLPEAIQKIRNGIRRYNASVGGVNSDTSGYHETITLAYSSLISHFIITHGASSIDDLPELLVQQRFLHRDYLLSRYSREVLMSSAARKNWVEPDKKQLMALV